MYTDRLFGYCVAQEVKLGQSFKEFPMIEKHTQVKKNCINASFFTLLVLHFSFSSLQLKAFR